MTKLRLTQKHKVVLSPWSIISRSPEINWISQLSPHIFRWPWPITTSTVKKTKQNKKPTKQRTNADIFWLHIGKFARKEKTSGELHSLPYFTEIFFHFVFYSVFVGTGSFEKPRAPGLTLSLADHGLRAAQLSKCPWQTRFVCPPPDETRCRWALWTL